MTPDNLIDFSSGFSFAFSLWVSGLTVSFIWGIFQIFNNQSDGQF